MTKAYLLGALHDGVIRQKTCRIVQKDQAYINFLKKGILSMEQKAWSYKEGKDRNLYVVEFSRNFIQNFKINTQQDKIDYIRGYFDAEGGIPRNSHVRYYIYFAQKNFEDLGRIKSFLQELNIECGIIHNPSKNVDPNYWRFFIRAQSYARFAEIINSWHPIKRHFLRMKI